MYVVIVCCSNSRFLRRSIALWMILRSVEIGSPCPNPEKARKAVTEALDRVGDGVGILFFAEGSRSVDGKLKAFKKGAFRTAVSQQLPILPITIDGTRNIQRPRSLIVRPGRVRMVIHPAIEVGGDDAADIRDLMNKTRDAIASALPAELQ